MRLFILFFLFITTSCFSQDYSITMAKSQEIDAKNVLLLEIECYCKNEIKIIETPKAMAMQSITLEIRATESSVGYHGKQKKPNTIKDEFLNFTVERKDTTLKISSNEWSFMHHSFMIDSLKIHVPKGVKFKFTKIPADKLEGRKNVF